MQNNLWKEPVPTKYKEVLILREVKRLKFRERLRLLLGLNFYFEARIYLQHKCGQTKQYVKMETTPLMAAPIVSEEELAAMLEKQNK